MEQYNITGMSCAACVSRVERAVNSVDGVKSCAVNLLTNSMNVEGAVSSEKIIKAVIDAGYGATLKSNSKDENSKLEEDSIENVEIRKLKKRLISSIILLIPLMYVSMGHMLLNFPIPSFMNENHVVMGLYQLLLSSLIMFINKKFFISGFKGVLHRSPNMDTLVALGSSASFCYSVYAIFSKEQFYFESAAMILTLITVGKTLEAYSKGKTTNALKALMKLSPKTAVILVDGKETQVPIEKVKVGDKFIVRPGESVCVDGIVIEGESALNESALTGESVPVEKKVGDEVSAATINTSGFLICKAIRVGENTTLANIIQMVSDASSSKAPISKIADSVSGVFVPIVIVISIITFIVWMIVGESFGYVISRAVSVLVISCPCSLGLATPVAIMVGNGVGAKNGILFKTASSLEQVGKTKIIALDKTGTITTGVMQVTDVISDSNIDKKELLEIAYSLESKSEHPISKAITRYAKENNIKQNETTNFETVSGNGLNASINGEKCFGGNYEYIVKSVETIDSTIKSKIDELSKEGKTPVLFSKKSKMLGIIALSDTIKEDSAKAIDCLKKMGIKTIMLTGDNSITANAISKKVGVDEVISELKPDGKEDAIRNLMKRGKVSMVGDGINDAPALTLANTGIAIGAGTDIAIDSADIVLMKSNLIDVVSAIKISRATIKNIHENLFWAFFYNIIGIPLAAGCFIKAFGWTLNPMFGAAAMGLSSFCVISNALRLNFIKVNKNKSNTNNSSNKEGLIMKITVKGMMCSHCESHVKKALEAIDGIVSATANHEESLVTIETSKTVEEALIKSAVENAGYEYVGLK